jgi:bacterioferritin-associated ferredoxin
VYVCNCNGIREREVRAAISAGARRPADIFKSKACTAKCAKCVCDMRGLISEARRTISDASETILYAAE